MTFLNLITHQLSYIFTYLRKYENATSFTILNVFELFILVEADLKTVCSTKRYIGRKLDKSEAQRCYEEDSCGVIKRVITIPKSCLEIGCGVDRPLDDVCCLMCKRDKPKISCDLGRMKVVVPKSLMSKEVFLNSSLIDPKCKGYESRRNFLFETNIFKCGTVSLKTQEGRESFSNEVTTLNGETKSLFFKMFCTFEQKSSTGAFYKIKQKKVSSAVKGIKLAFTSKGGRLLVRKDRFLASEKRLDVSISSLVAKRFNLRVVLNWCYLSVSKWIAWKNGKENYLIRNG